MALHLFNHTDYKAYLNQRIESDLQARGLRQKISEHIQCQPSYLSQVLNGNPDLTLEQAQRLNGFLHHTQIESRYFILLVQLARAGTQELKELFLEQIKEIQKSRFDLKKRLKTTEDIPESAQNRYYSAWFYSAIHVSLSIPGLRTPSKIAQHFNLPLNLVTEAIEFLEETGLIEEKKGVYHYTKRRIHLDRNSPFIQRHHINWRSQALLSAEKNLPDDLHYSVVVAISEEDFKKMKEILIAGIEKARQLIGPSKEEKIYALTMDFFEM